jgi:hypothetical protein
MGSHVVASGEFLVRASATAAFLDAWGDGFIEDHDHTWACVSRYMGNASVREFLNGDVEVSVERWSDLDYLATALLERISPHVVRGAFVFEYEFVGDDNAPWTIEIIDGDMREE